MSAGDKDAPVRDVAVVGLGNQGGEHVRALAATRLPLRLAAAVDLRGAPSDLALPEHCPVFSSITELPESVGAVIVATPPMTYRSIVPDLLESGRHVLLEKPLGVDLTEALRLVEKAEERDRVLMPAVQRRFHPTYRQWAEWREKVGRLREALIYMSIRHAGEEWRASLAEAGGGALFDLGFHAIDLAQQLFGDLRLQVSFFFDREGRPCHDGFDFEADMLLLSETGVTVRLHVARAASAKKEEVVVRGDRGTLEIGRDRLRFTNSENEVQEMTADSSWAKAMEAQMHFWHGAMRTKEGGQAADEAPHDIPAWNGVSAMRMMEEAYGHGRCS